MPVEICTLAWWKMNSMPAGSVLSIDEQDTPEPGIEERILL